MDLTSFISEMREDFQLPPYLSDDSIKRAITHANQRLKQLRPNIEPIEDDSSTYFVKMYSYYIICKKGDEFEKDYQNDLLSWQLSAEGGTE